MSSTSASNLDGDHDVVSIKRSDCKDGKEITFQAEREVIIDGERFVFRVLTKEEQRDEVMQAVAMMDDQEQAESVDQS